MTQEQINKIKASPAGVVQQEVIELADRAETLLAMRWAHELTDALKYPACYNTCPMNGPCREADTVWCEHALFEHEDEWHEAYRRNLNK